jgi:hypothetical protein
LCGQRINFIDEQFFSFMNIESSSNPDLHRLGEYAGGEAASGGQGELLPLFHGAIVTSCG